LLKVDLMSRYTFSNKVELLRGLADQLAVEHQNSFELFAGCFVEAPASILGPENYPHLKEDLDILSCYLRQALVERRLGVNVLIFGRPGTGKTELCRMLSGQLGAQAFAVSTEGENGEPLKGETRFRSFRLSQSILKKGGPHLILFDEVEDVFRQGQEDHGHDRGNLSGMKGWINQILETNPVPTFWVTNSIETIDKAFIRRFDFVLEMAVPPRSVRSKVLNDYLVGLPMDESTKASLANNEHLAPAFVARAVRVLRSVHSDDSTINLDKALERIIGNTLEATGVSREAMVTVQNLTSYRPELLNADCDLIELKAGLMKHGKGRLCLYGPPGSGKTAYGLHIAETLNRSLVIKRASDLQSKWVGGTEKNLAAMFQEAKQEKAVLLLDEADSFFRSRQGAERSWEVSQVNEMLTQMETFDGVFIASTNLMDTLDAASLRRFDLKIEFRFLKPEGAWSLFQDTAVSLGFDVEESDRLKLGRVRNLTPGDFANVMRQSRLRPIKSAAQLLDQLKAEVALKPESRTKSLGF
jgi:SpoVK/Ycf46/Vps4 family AAA+-type ATPase